MTFRSKKVSDGERYSVIQPKLDKCYFCGAVPIEKHEIFSGTANRQKSKDYGMVVALCPMHHRLVHQYPKKGYAVILHADGQMAFEKMYSREKFIEIFGKSYL